MAEDLSQSYYIIGVYVSIKQGKYTLGDYEVDVTRTNVNTGAQVTRTRTIADALEVKIGDYIKTTNASDLGQEVRFDTRDEDGERFNFNFYITLYRSKMELPPGTFDAGTGKVTPGPPISPQYAKAYDILTNVENRIKEVLTTAYGVKDSSNWKGREKIKDGLPVPMTFEFESVDDPIQNVFYKGDGGWRIGVKVNNIALDPTESYIPDTSAFRRRGLVKIQGSEEYRAAGQVIGKDLVGNAETVASNNQTHINGSETDEQVENSIAVSVWYFKNKTSGNVNSLELRSKIPKDKYVSEYQRIKGILG
jgi:hypothetical protein